MLKFSHLQQRRVSAVQAAAPLAYTGNAGMLFQQSEGKPYDFWVQVELRNRKKIVDIIKVGSLSGRHIHLELKT